MLSPRHDQPRQKTRFRERVRALPLASLLAELCAGARVPLQKSDSSPRRSVARCRRVWSPREFHPGPLSGPYLSLPADVPLATPEPAPRDTIPPRPALVPELAE